MVVRHKSYVEHIMAGKVGNPYRDPETGKFASAGGLNRDNSTMVQRAKGAVKNEGSKLKKYIAGAAAIAAGTVGMAIVKGFAGPLHSNAEEISDAAIKAARAYTNAKVKQHGPTIAKAVKAKGSSLANHVRNMKVAKPTAQGSTNVNVTFSKPTVRVKMGSNNISPPKTRTVMAGPMGRASIGKPVYRVPMGRK